MSRVPKAQSGQATGQAEGSYGPAIRATEKRVLGASLACQEQPLEGSTALKLGASCRLHQQPGRAQCGQPWVTVEHRVVSLEDGAGSWAVPDTHRAAGGLQLRQVWKV